MARKRESKVGTTPAKAVSRRRMLEGLGALAAVTACGFERRRRFGWQRGQSRGSGRGQQCRRRTGGRRARRTKRSRRACRWRRRSRRARRGRTKHGGRTRRWRARRRGRRRERHRRRRRHGEHGPAHVTAVDGRPGSGFYRFYESEEADLQHHHEDRRRGPGTVFHPRAGEVRRHLALPARHPRSIQAGCRKGHRHGTLRAADRQDEERRRLREHRAGVGYRRLHLAHGRSGLLQRLRHEGRSGRAKARRRVQRHAWFEQPREHRPFLPRHPGHRCQWRGRVPERLSRLVQRPRSSHPHRVLQEGLDVTRARELQQEQREGLDLHDSILFRSLVQQADSRVGRAVQAAHEPARLRGRDEGRRGRQQRPPTRPRRKSATRSSRRFRWSSTRPDRSPRDLPLSSGRRANDPEARGACRIVCILAPSLLALAHCQD